MVNIKAKEFAHYSLLKLIEAQAEVDLESLRFRELPLKFAPRCRIVSCAFEYRIRRVGSALGPQPAMRKGGERVFGGWWICMKVMQI
ncbi:hypothetical protein AS026_19610 [Rhizobium altiplani]|uniref:Uncharacterized protein n=1 Tax=Rhizobium altiplani TaxID=1864509 RepID=A0A120FFX6_9HYPH|nr:hypothetical protein AS026_19610 [Rhizobium altiplani]